VNEKVQVLPGIQDNPPPSSPFKAFGTGLGAFVATGVRMPSRDHLPLSG